MVFAHCVRAVSSIHRARRARCPVPRPSCPSRPADRASSRRREQQSPRNPVQTPGRLHSRPPRPRAAPRAQRLQARGSIGRVRLCAYGLRVPRSRRRLPGSWSMYAAQKIAAVPGKLLAVDLTDHRPCFGPERPLHPRRRPLARQRRPRALRALRRRPLRHGPLTTGSKLAGSSFPQLRALQGARARGSPKRSRRRAASFVGKIFMSAGDFAAPATARAQSLLRGAQ